MGAVRAWCRSQFSLLATIGMSALVVFVVACSSDNSETAPPSATSVGSPTGSVSPTTGTPDTGGSPSGQELPLIPATAGLETLRQLVKDPNRDSLPDDQRIVEQIQWGYSIVTDTPTNAPQYVGGSMSCTNCHLSSGQKDKGLPYIGISAMFPEYNPRNGTMRSLEDRIVDCFERSENAPETPREDSPEVLAVATYITWLSEGAPTWENPSWRGQNRIAEENLIPIDELDPAKGEQLYEQQCASCHGADGQGVLIGEVKAGPLWGDGSWNDGAGAGRVYTLAGFIRWAMPYTTPGSLSDEDAQQIAAFINSHDRPSFQGKDEDYPEVGPPVDAVYYPQRYPENPLKR